MAIKKLDQNNQVINDTDTDLQVLKSIEKAFYRNNKGAVNRNTEKSLKWFSQYIPKSYSRVRTSQMMRDQSLIQTKIEPGNIYLAAYDPIHKDTLPVWDEFPLLMPWDAWRGDNGKEYIISINLHYLPPSLRFVAMKAILQLRSEKRYRKSTKLKMSWAILKSLSTSKLFEHSVKMYRVDHFRSLFIKIPPKSWEMAVFLPLARWKKGGKAEAWKI